jgi:ubiquinone/menaquinone biosynthesis C-methylase UbiE
MDKVRLYDESAAVYHRRYHRIQRTKYQALAPYLQEGPLVDVGVGTGIGLSTLAKLHPVVGVDGSIEMLRIAQSLAAADEARSAPVFLVCAEATELPFRASSFSTAVSVTVLQNLSDREQGVSELLRAIQPGGLLGITALKRSLSLHELETLTAGATALVARLTDLANEDVGLVLRRATRLP